MQVIYISFQFLQPQVPALRRQLLTANAIELYFNPYAISIPSDSPIPQAYIIFRLADTVNDR